MCVYYPPPTPPITALANIIYFQTVTLGSQALTPAKTNSLMLPTSLRIRSCTSNFFFFPAPPILRFYFYRSSVAVVLMKVSPPSSTPLSPHHSFDVPETHQACLPSGPLWEVATISFHPLLPLPGTHCDMALWVTALRPLHKCPLFREASLNHDL